MLNVQFLCDILDDIKKTFNTRLVVRGSESNILEIQSHHQVDFRHCNFRGCFTVVAIFYFECHTYNYSLNGERASISPVFLKQDNHFRTEGVYSNARLSSENIPTCYSKCHSVNMFSLKEVT